jgi:hypothetical protein
VTEKLGEYKGEDCKLLALRNTVKSFPEFLRGKQSTCPRESPGSAKQPGEGQRFDGGTESNNHLCGTS